MYLHAGRRAVSGAIIVAVAVVVVAAAVGAYFFLQPSGGAPNTGGSSSSATSSSQTTTSQTSAAGSVKTRVDGMIQAFNTRNVPAVVAFYDSKAVVTWGPGSTAGGLAGTYTGPSSITILYGSSIGRTTILTATAIGYSEKSTGPSSINSSFTLSLTGNSSILGGINATIGVTQAWLNAGGAWQIDKENWNYKTFVVQFPQTGTTFPQWGLLLHGKSPDIVSEKSLEWRAGPFVALSVYALLGVLVAFAVVRFRAQPGEP